ncbi:MAG: flagellar M-ring protein FliF [Firmicutes bacterium]|nr:flagellar M-ring protein FliF [Bacillota bacterium]
MAVQPFESNNRAGDALKQGRQLLSGFTSGQKTVAALFGIILLLIIYFFSTHSSSPSYETLYANLQPSQAGQVTQKLSAAGIPYQLSDGGATVLVPDQYVNQERVALAEAGLPSGGTITFQTLAATGITSSQFVQNVDYQQALEGQLNSIIESIQGVSSAQVSLVMPSNSTFAIGNTQTPTASVLVDLNSGSTLTSGQVQGIVHLVSSAVPELSANNVTVVDNNGNVLSASSGSISASTDLSEENTYDSALAATLNNLLSLVVGPNNASVQVHAVMNFNQLSTKTNGFEVGKNGKPITAPTSVSKTKDSFTGTGSQAAGILGSGQIPTSQNGKYLSTQSQTQSAVGSVTQIVNQAPGQVIKTSVAVLVNSAKVKTAQIAAIRSLITTAAGLNLKTGDKIIVTALPFAPPPKQLAITKTSLTASLFGHLPTVGLLILILLMFFLSMRAAKKRKPVFQEIPMTPLASIGAADNPTIELPAVSISGNSMLNQADSPVTPDVESYIQTSPDEVASLMRNWSEERGRGR